MFSKVSVLSSPKKGEQPLSLKREINNNGKQSNLSTKIRMNIKVLLSLVLN